jgi:ABC-type transport system involved in cytochrome c biogenesis ATPase subunit
VAHLRTSDEAIYYRNDPIGKNNMLAVINGLVKALVGVLAYEVKSHEEERERWSGRLVLIGRHRQKDSPLLGSRA